MRGVGNFVSLPLFSGCASRSSIATKGSTVSTTRFQEPKLSEINYPTEARRQENENKPSSGVKMKSSTSFFLVLPIRFNLSNGVHKFVSSLKNFSQLFVLKKDKEEEEVEMEIGYPTDVKHVTHIGLDGSTNTNTNPLKGWENLNNFVPPEIFSFPSISLSQFEVSMAAQTHDPLLDVKHS